MRIGFIILRDTFFKTLGKLVEASAQAGHKPVLLYDSVSSLGSKSSQSVTPEKLAVFAGVDPEVHEFQYGDLDKVSGKFGVDVVCVHEGYHFLQGKLDKVQVSRKAGARFVSLPHFFEIAHHPPAALEAFDLTVYLSDYARYAHFEIAEATNQLPAYQAKSFVGGSPMFDQLRGLNKVSAKAELGLPADKAVILLMSPVISPITPWRYQFWRGQSQLGRLKGAFTNFTLRDPLQSWVPNDWSEIFASIRAFANRNNALLLTKSRGKQPNQQFEISGSDQYFDGTDDVYYPTFSTYKLMAAADLCITVNSMAAAEAVAAGVPSINIYVPHTDFSGTLSRQDVRYYDEFLNGTPGSLMNYQGCVWSVHHRNSVGLIGKSSLADFRLDPKARQDYVSKFLGIEDIPASQRILTKIESLI